MSEMIKEAEKNERPEPLTLKYPDGTTYTLEFNRESVVFAETRGISVDAVGERLMTMLPEFFFCAFRMHHPQLKKTKTDKILFEDLGGLTTKQLERLILLFNEPYKTLVSEDEEQKNAKLTVIM